MNHWLRQRIPKGFRLKAQGCAERATLGIEFEVSPTPNGVAADRRTKGRNPVGVEIVYLAHPG